MPEPESSKAHGPSRTRGMREIRAEASRLNRQVLLPAERFIHSETISGGLLLVCAIVAVAWRHIMGAGLIGGVGFTVALFITGLAFTESVFVEEAKVGVLCASFIAALGGYLFRLLVSRGQK